MVRQSQVKMLCLHSFPGEHLFFKGGNGFHTGCTRIKREQKTMDATEIKDWLKIRISFRTKCLNCGKDILPGQALWSKSTKSAKHLACNNIERIDFSEKREKQTITTSTSLLSNNLQVIELKCFVCGNRTGCKECEHLTNCEQRMVSKYCICEECSKHEELFDNYQQSFLVKASGYLK
jgi:hypothetical protein